MADSDLIGRGGNPVRNARLNHGGHVYGMKNQPNNVNNQPPAYDYDYGYFPSRPNIMSPDFLPPTRPARPIAPTAPKHYCPPKDSVYGNPAANSEYQWRYILPDYHNTTRDDVQAGRGAPFGYGDDWDLRRGICHNGNKRALGPVIPPPTDPLYAPLTAGAYQQNLQFDDYTDMGMATFGGPRSADADPSIVGKNVRTRNATYLGDPNARPPSHLDPRNLAHMPNPGAGMTGAQAGYLPRGGAGNGDVCEPLGFNWNDRYEVLAHTGAVSRSDHANGGPESYRGADPAAAYFGPDPPGGPNGQVPEHAATGRTYTYDEQVAYQARRRARDTAGIDRRIVSPMANMDWWQEELDVEERKPWWGFESAYS